MTNVTPNIDPVAAEILEAQAVEPSGTAQPWRDGIERADELEKFDSFDYLDGTLIDWVDKFIPEVSDDPIFQRELQIVQDEYLPRFEAALWRAAAEMNAAGIRLNPVA